MDDVTTGALRTLADKPVAGLLTARVECAVDEDMAHAVNTLAATVGSKGKAVRLLITEGARALLRG